MTQTELPALVHKAQAGDPQAQEELIVSIQDRVYYHCRKMLKNESDAQDAAQDVLIIVLTNLDKLREPAAFYGWVNGITANRCKHLLTQGVREWQMPEDEDGGSMLDDLEDLDQQTVPEAVLNDKETQRLLMEIIDALPPEQRMSVLFYYYDEMSVKEIAQAMETSEGTVKSRLNYARRSIKAGVEDLEKRGTKLYGLAPLPLLLFLLRQEAAGLALSADQSARLTSAAVSAAQAEMAGAAAGTAEAAAAETAGAAAASAGTAAAAGGAAAKAGLSIGAKIALGLAALALTGGAVLAGSALLNREEEPEPTPEPSVLVEESEPEPSEEEPEPEPSESQGPSEELLALLDSVVYYGDKEQCRMTQEQASAFAETIRVETARVMGGSFPGTDPSELGCFAALFDVGDGTPALFFAGGTTYISPVSPPEEGVVEWGTYPGSHSIWEYRDGQAVQYASGNCLVQREGGLYLINLNYSMAGTDIGNIYALTGSAISDAPVAVGGIEFDGQHNLHYKIDGVEVTQEEHQAWAEQWDEDILCGSVHYGGGTDGSFIGLGDADATADALERYGEEPPEVHGQAVELAGAMTVNDVLAKLDQW